MHTRNTRRFLAASALIAPLLASSEAASYALEEVVVTAQKKAESLQDTPISLTAFGEDRLENEGISSLGDIGSKVPALTIEPFPINNATLRIFIRGIGITDAQVTQDPPVGIYVDGAYVARSTGTALDVAELVRMEILRGPQGTLYGRNTTGGAINLITKKPNTEEWEVKQKLTVANRNAITSKTSINIPVRDDMAVKLSYLNTRSDGYVDNGGPGGDWGDRKVEGYRFDWRWNISDTIAMDYAFDQSDLRYHNYTYQPNTPPTARGTVVDLILPIAEQGVRDGPGYQMDRKGRLNAAADAPLEESFTSITGHSITFTFDLGETTQFKYIGAYRDLDDNAYADLSGGAGVEDDFSDPSNPQGYGTHSQAWTAPDGEMFPLVIPNVLQQQWSHEFQLSGDLFEGAVSYIAGYYRFKEAATEDNGPAHHQFHAAGQADLNGDGVGDFPIVVANVTENFYKVRNEAEALFMQFTWTPAFNDRMSLTFGARHSRDKRFASKDINDRVYGYSNGARFDVTNNGDDCTDAATLVICQTIANSGLITVNPNKVFFSERNRDFKDDSFAFTFEYDITDDINTYFKIIEAYKSGGFNTRDPHQNAADEAANVDDQEAIYGLGFEDGFAEEKVLSYEWGVKSELLDRRLRVNANVFFSEYSDIQLNILIPGTVADTKVTNAGEAEMLGFEADVTYMALENLMLILNYAWLDTEVTKATQPATGEDLTDRFVYNSAPRNSYTALADFTFAAGDWGRAFLNMSVNYMDERNGGNQASGVKNLKLNDYYLWNARVGIADMPFAGGMLNMGVWGKNIFDTDEYELTTVDNLPTQDRGTIYGEPATYGVDFIWSWAM